MGGGWPVDSPISAAVAKCTTAHSAVSGLKLLIARGGLARLNPGTSSFSACGGRAHVRERCSCRIACRRKPLEASFETASEVLERDLVKGQRKAGVIEHSKTKIGKCFRCGRASRETNHTRLRFFNGQRFHNNSTPPVAIAGLPVRTLQTQKRSHRARQGRMPPGRGRHPERCRTATGAASVVLPRAVASSGGGSGVDRMA